MKTPKESGFSLFKHEKTETGSVWQLQIPLPAGLTVTFKVDKKQSAATETRLQEAPEAASVVDSISAPIPTPAPVKKENIKSWFKSPENILFTICILIYLMVRVIGLTDYPVYFNFDEADKTVLAADFLRDGFRNYAGEMWPAFFPNPGGNFNVGSTAVYVQILPMLLFGRSDFVIRFTVVLLGLIGAICLSLALRDIFRLRYWWAGILVLSFIPAWYHHSRTGYEMPTFASFYCTMLYFYWLYRAGKKRFIYPSVLFAGLAFYSYAPAQAIVPLTVVAMFILDMPYHFRGGVSALGGAVLGIICVIPYIRFQIDHAGSSAQVLSHVSSYLIQDIPLTDKITAFLQLYFYHLSPQYWFTPAYDVTPYDGLLHIMKGYGHLGLWLIPFLCWGLWLLIRRLRQAQYRGLLAAFLIAPVSASLVTSPSSITRALVMVIPAALIASIGLDDLWQRAASRLRLQKTVHVSIALLLVLFSINSYMLWDVLHNGISWFDNNQANGVQFGASKVFPAVQEQLKSNPNANAIISPNWAMMEDMVSRIYLGDRANVTFKSIYDYDKYLLPMPEGAIFVLTPEEFDFAQKNPKFSDIKILETIPYSATKAGFYVINLRYSPQAKAIMNAETAELRKPVEDEILINGEKVQSLHTKSDGAVIQNAFDDDPGTVYKTTAINPAVITLTFPQEKEFHSIFIIHGSAPIDLQVTFLTADGKEIKTYTAKFTQNGGTGNTLTFDQTIKAAKVNITVKSSAENENGTVHIWQISFK